jgi:ubiquinone biosynthesis protein COQ4
MLNAPLISGQSTSDSVTNRVQLLLKSVDFLGDRLGLSVPTVVREAELRSLPPDSLGQAWISSLDQQQLRPLTSGPRRKQLHDGVHVLTGYGTDLIGEAEVQAFLLGAKFHGIQIVLLLGLLRPIYKQLIFTQQITKQEVRQRLRQAYQRGQHSHFDVDAWRPEDQWQLPLPEVQNLLGL